MPRPPRLDPPASWHHLFNRRPTGRRLVRNDDDRRDLLGLLHIFEPRFGVEVHAYAVMDTHFHLLVRSRAGGVARAMRDLQHRWSLELSRRYGEVGPAFRARYGSRLIEDERYLIVALAYIHLNPVREGLAPDADSAEWTSHPAYRGLVPAPPWLHTATLTAAFGGAEALHQEVVERSDLSEEIFAQALEPIEQTQGPNAPPVQISPEEVPPFAVEDLIASLEAVAGARLDELGAPRAGARRNAPLHFALHVMVTRSPLTHREIGALLGITARQVAWMVHSQKSGLVQEVAALVERWEAEQADPLSAKDAR